MYDFSYLSTTRHARELATRRMSVELQDAPIAPHAIQISRERNRHDVHRTRASTTTITATIAVSGTPTRTKSAKRYPPGP